MFKARKQIENMMWLAWLYAMPLFLFSFSEMTKLFQLAVPVVLILLCLIPTVDAPICTGMYMQININSRKMFHRFRGAGLAHGIHLSVNFSLLLLSAL